MLSVRRQRGFIASLACVLCVHLFRGTAYTSGAIVQELRMEASVPASVDAEIAPADSSPVHSVSATRVMGSSVEIAVPPLTVSANRIFPVRSQWMSLGGVLRWGVRLCAGLSPAAGTA